MGIVYYAVCNECDKEECLGKAGPSLVFSIRRFLEEHYGHLVAILTDEELCEIRYIKSGLSHVKSN